MTIEIKHKFVSAIPDSGDTTIVQPSNWNDDHDLTGIGTMAEQDANAVAITGGTISGVTIPASNVTGTLQVNQGGTGATTLTGYVKGAGTTALTASSTIPNTDITGLGTASTKDAGVANGVATLDAGGKVPVSELPAAVLGALSYQGTWNASTNTPTLTSSVGTKGYYYVVSVAGNTNLDGITDWLVGDWAVYNGTVWQKVDNTETVTSVNGQTGAVVLTASDVGAQPAGTYVTSVSATSPVTSSGGTTPTIAMPAANSTTNGYLTSTDWNTFNTISTGGVVGPASATDNAIARYDGTTGKLIQNSVVTVSDTGGIAGATTITDINYIDFNTGYTTTLAAGQMGWDGNNTLGLGMSGGNIVQEIGLQSYIYGKASSAITKGQLIKKTGANGSSGVITFAPTTANMTNSGDVIGIAAEDIALNGFGYITSVGNLRGFNTTGSSSGETWADGDTLYYNPSGNGLMTKVKPSAPNIKTEVAIVTNAGSGGSGSVVVEIIHGSQLGGTDSNVQINGVTGGQLLSYDQTNGYWKNTSLTAGTAISVSAATGGTITVNNTGVTSAVAGTGISVSGATGAVTITNTAPDQTVSLTAGTGISVSGTYPSFTIANTGVTSVSGTTGRITSSGGATPAIDLASGIVTAGTTGSSTLIPVITVDTYGRVTSITTASNPQGTVTSVTGTAPIVSSGGATPAISIPKATSSVDGYLSSTDWTTFNNKGSGTVTSVSALTLGTTGTDLSSTVANGTTTPVITLNVPTASATNRGALSSTDWTTFNNKAPAVTYTTNYVPYGQGTTTPNQSSSFTFDGTTQTAPIQRASNGIVTNNKTIGTSFTIPSTDNAMSAGPVTLSSGVTVTVSSGSRWVVL